MKGEILFFAAVLMFSAASAHGGAHEGLPEPGATPGSMMFGLERAQESVSLALTFNKKKKAQKKLKFAQERLAESKKLAEQNRSDRASRAVEMYQKQFKDAEKSAKELPPEARKGMSQELNETSSASVGVLKDLKEKLPEEAMKGINTAIEAQQRRGKPESAGEQPDQNDQVPGSPEERPGQDESETPDNISGEQVERERGAYVATGRVIKNDISGTGSTG